MTTRRDFCKASGAALLAAGLPVVVGDGIPFLPSNAHAFGIITEATARYDGGDGTSWAQWMLLFRFEGGHSLQVYINDWDDERTSQLPSLIGKPLTGSFG